MIYADNAATTRLDPDAFEAMKPYLLEQYGNASQPYSFSRAPKKALKESRSIIADCIGALPEEIYFTSGGTESNNWVLKRFAHAGVRKQVITSAIEHHAIINACRSMADGAETILLPVNKKGLVSASILENILDKRQIDNSSATLVSIMLVNNEIGTIEPISEIARIAHTRGALCHTDAVQAIGHIPVNVSELGIDMLSASGHKFNGPKGVGFLYVRKGTPLLPFSDGGGQEAGMRAGTENIASIVAMATALKKNCEEMKQVSAKLHRMEDLFLKELSSAGVDFIHNGAEYHAPGIISLSIKNTSGEMLLHRMDLKGICISTGSACDSVNTNVSHVIKAIDVPSEYAKGTIRISFGRLNVEEDALEVANALIGILKKTK